MALNPFSPKLIKRILEDDLYDAERESLIAASQAEHWQASYEMLQRRIERLRASLELIKFQATQTE